MIEKIMYNNEIIAIVSKRNLDDKEKSLEFYTPSDNPLQIGTLNHPRGYVIPSHIHNNVERRITETQEMLYVEKGKMRVSFLTESNEKIDERTLNPGDLVVLMRKGHGFEFLEDSRVIYVKQGPYLDKAADKRVFN